MNKKENIKPLGSPKVVYQWNIVQLVEQDMQKWKKIKTFEYAERAPGVRILVVNDTWKICLTRERRTELSEGKWWWDYRLPGGKVFDKLKKYNTFRKDEGDILEIAKNAVQRELEEETWLTPLSIKHLHTSPCGATMRWDLYYFLVEKFKQHPDGQNLGFSENIEVFWFTKEEVKEKCLNKSISEDRTVAVLLRYILTS